MQDSTTKQAGGEGPPGFGADTIEAAMRERVRVVMRYAGPRMLLRHPVLTLLHLRDERLPLSEKAQKEAERIRKQA